MVVVRRWGKRSAIQIRLLIATHAIEFQLSKCPVVFSTTACLTQRYNRVNPVTMIIIVLTRPEKGPQCPPTRLLAPIVARVITPKASHRPSASIMTVLWTTARRAMAITTLYHHRLLPQANHLPQLSMRTCQLIRTILVRPVIRIVATAIPWGLLARAPLIISA